MCRNVDCNIETSKRRSYDMRISAIISPDSLSFVSSYPIPNPKHAIRMFEITCSVKGGLHSLRFARLEVRGRFVQSRSSDKFRRSLVALESAQIAFTTLHVPSSNWKENSGFRLGLATFLIFKNRTLGLADQTTQAGCRKRVNAIDLIMQIATANTQFSAHHRNFDWWVFVWTRLRANAFSSWIPCCSQSWSLIRNHERAQEMKVEKRLQCKPKSYLKLEAVNWLETSIQSVQTSHTPWTLSCKIE